MSEREWHRLLQRQLRRLLGDAPAPCEWRPLLDMVSRAYEQADADRLMLERSLDLSSNELLAANRDLRSIFSLLPDMFFRVGDDGIILDANVGALVDAEQQGDLRGKRLQDAPPACGGPLLAELLAAARATGERVVRDLEFKIGNQVRAMEASLIPLNADEYVIFVRDITARRRAEEEIQRLAAAIEQAADAVLITDTAGVIQYVNPAFEHISGYTRAEVVGQTPALFKSGRHDSQFYERLWSTITSGHVWRGHLTDRRKDNTVVELNTTISPVRDSNGRIVNYVAVSHDVTRETELQDQLRQAQKMEAIGRLAGGIAHDFNNLLTAILGNADLVLHRLDPNAPVREDIEQIREAAQQAADLVMQLLTFSRKQVVNPRVLQLNETVASLSRMLKRVIGQHIRLETSLESNLAPIRIDPTQLEQVIMNLALNARDAMPKGGTLTLSTRSVRIKSPDASHPADIRPGDYSVLDVIDTGIGMDAKTQARIFEPFFTTKETGRGTGLGLSIVYGIAKQCGGAIQVRSAPGEGTTFSVYFPHAQASSAIGSGADVHPDARRRTILLVDDEAPIRKLVHRMLQNFGYDVLVAADGQEAMDCLRRTGTRIDLIITDVIMPKLDGLRLAALAHAEFPNLPVILMSGHPETADLKPEDLSGTPLYVRKPFRAEQLRETIERALRSDVVTPQ